MSKPTKTKIPLIKKAFENLDFLASKDARPLRILSEYLYPKLQLEEQNVKDTIVIFGSARAPSPEDLNSQERLSKNTKLAEYYDATRASLKKIDRVVYEFRRRRSKNMLFVQEEVQAL